MDLDDFIEIYKKERTISAKAFEYDIIAEIRSIGFDVVKIHGSFYIVLNDRYYTARNSLSKESKSNLVLEAVFNAVVTVIIVYGLAVVVKDPWIVMILGILSSTVFMVSTRVTFQSSPNYRIYKHGT